MFLNKYREREGLLLFFFLLIDFSEIIIAVIQLGKNERTVDFYIHVLLSHERKKLQGRKVEKFRGFKSFKFTFKIYFLKNWTICISIVRVTRVHWFLVVLDHYTRTTRHCCVILPQRFIQLEVFHTKVKRVVTIAGQALSPFFFRSKLGPPPFFPYPYPLPRQATYAASSSSCNRSLFLQLVSLCFNSYNIFFSPPKSR